IATAMPIGTLTTNTERQPHASTKSPPMVGPSAAASAPAAPQSAMACGTLDLGKACRISASDAGVSAAAPHPCRTLAATSTPTPGATAQMADATVKTPIPARKTRRRPRRSAHRPAPDTPRREDDRVTGKDPRQRGGADVGEVATEGAEGDVEHHRVEGRHERGRGDDRQTRPRSGRDLVIGREPGTLHVAGVYMMYVMSTQVGATADLLGCRHPGTG